MMLAKSLDDLDAQVKSFFGSIIIFKVFLCIFDICCRGDTFPHKQTILY